MPYLPEDPAFSTGGWLIFKCRYFCTLVSSVRPDLKWDNVVFWFMLQVGPIQSYLNLKIGLPPVLKAVSSGISKTYYYHKIIDSNNMY